jgi:hypothetical protein
MGFTRCLTELFKGKTVISLQMAAETNNTELALRKSFSSSFGA